MKSFLLLCASSALFVVAGSCAVAAQANAPTAAQCVAPATQKLMNDCAYEDFLTANAGYADSNKTIMGKLPGKQRELFRRSQKAWVAYSAAACDFESSAAAGGSALGMVKWQCMARLARQRVVDLAKLGDCKEGDVSCVRFKQ